MFISIKKHDCTRIIKFIHFVKIRNFCNINLKKKEMKEKDDEREG